MANPRIKDAPGTSLIDRQRQRQTKHARRAALVASMTAAKCKSEPTIAKAEPRYQRDLESCLRALSEVPLHSVGEAHNLAVSDSYRELLRIAIGVMNTGRPHAVLCWPNPRTCIPAIVALLSLADVASARRTSILKGGLTLEAAESPRGVRAVVYPHARTVHTAASEIQVDREALGRLQLLHQTRRLSGEVDPALDDYHSVLARVRSMTGQGSDGEQYGEFLHPVLDEIVPHGSPMTGCPESGTLLWRTKTKTDLKLHRRTGEGDDPAKARFFMFSLRAADRIERELKAIHPSPDIFLLDLSKTGRGRLGRDWVEVVKETITTLARIHPSTGILALTDDPWSFDAVRFDILGTRSSKRRGGAIPSASSAVFTPTASIVKLPDAIAETEWLGGSRVTVDGFAGGLRATFENLRILDTKLRAAGDPGSSEIVRGIVGKLRRAASLPGSLAELSDFLEQEAGDAVAADCLSGYRLGPDLASLTDPHRSAGQVASGDLTALVAEVTKLIGAAESTTPMSSLVEDALQPSLRSSSRSVFLFRNEMIADFASDRLSRGFSKLVERFDSGMITFTSRQGFPDVVAMPSKLRNQIKRAVLVAPTREHILEFLSQSWLPDEVHVLADSETLRFAARDAVRLASLLNVVAIKRRLERFASSCGERLQQIGCHVVSLDSAAVPSDDVEFPSGSIVDLAGTATTGPLIELRMQNGQRIRARPGTGIVLRNNSRSVSRFVEVEAKDVREGDEVCVISAGFVERARSLLNISAAAAEEIRDYHEQVREKFAAIPGTTVSDRLRTLIGSMGAPHVAVDTARYWVDLDDELRKPLHEVVPHAPQDRDTFMRFTEALGIGTRLAARFWAWAIITQRSSRLRAGAAFHDAYKGILTDPHAAQAENNSRTPTH